MNRTGMASGRPAVDNGSRGGRSYPTWQVSTPPSAPASAPATPSSSSTGGRASAGSRPRGSSGRFVSRAVRLDEHGRAIPRRCAACGTSNTTQWRTGPRELESLCNGTFGGALLFPRTEGIEAVCDSGSACREAGGRQNHSAEIAAWVRLKQPYSHGQCLWHSLSCPGLFVSAQRAVSDCGGRPLPGAHPLPLRHPMAFSSRAPLPLSSWRREGSPARAGGRLPRRLLRLRWPVRRPRAAAPHRPHGTWGLPLWILWCFHHCVWVPRRGWGWAAGRPPLPGHVEWGLSARPPSDQNWVRRPSLRRLAAAVHHCKEDAVPLQMWVLPAERHRRLFHRRCSGCRPLLR